MKSSPNCTDAPAAASGQNVDRRLRRMEAICLQLAEAVMQRKGSHAVFLVRKKPFAYYLDNHHGDGILAIASKVGPGDNQLLTQTQPDRFYLPAYIGPRGWVALRLDRGKIDWEEVRALLQDSYRRIAPKRLAATVSFAPS